jgi:hypothetical protein
MPKKAGAMNKLLAKAKQAKDRGIDFKTATTEQLAEVFGDLTFDQLEAIMADSIVPSYVHEMLRRRPKESVN